ncbi:MAG: PEGA domain-containing protein [Polyangiaceae bacterium]|nr:PEGA domain-containing protein [Polyangiaceae bacterium]
MGSSVASPAWARVWRSSSRRPRRLAPTVPGSGPPSTEFELGTDLVQKTKWAEALAAFERAQALRPHAVTLYNIGACQRAMGMYTVARETFERALARSAAEGKGELAASLADQTRTFVTEIEGLLARVKLDVRGAEGEPTSVTVDGRPLLARGPGEYVAGVRAPGLADAVPGRFTVAMNPGHHVLVVHREGAADGVIALDLRAGESSERIVDPARLPASIRVTSNLEAVVTINGKDAGPTPLDIQRPAGVYRIVLEREKFEPYSMSIDAKPGKPVKLHATLVPERVPITKRWWFWTGIGVVVAGAAVTTYALTRPDPVRPPLSGGGLGWTVPVQ